MSRTHLLVKPNIYFIGNVKGKLYIHTSIFKVVYFLQDIGLINKNNNLQIIIVDYPITGLAFYIKHSDSIIISSIIFEYFTSKFMCKIIVHEIMHYLIEKNSEKVIVWICRYYSTLYIQLLYKTTYLEELFCNHCTEKVLRLFTKES